MLITVQIVRVEEISVEVAGIALIAESLLVCYAYDKADQENERQFHLNQINNFLLIIFIENHKRITFNIENIALMLERKIEECDSCFLSQWLFIHSSYSASSYRFE